MKTIFEHIDSVKAQPHHIRKQVAFASAAIGTTVVAIVWFVGSIAMGTFAIGGGSFATMGQENITTTDNTSGDDGLAGVAAALPQSDAPAHIEIIDATPSGGVKKAEQTTIPF